MLMPYLYTEVATARCELMIKLGHFEMVEFHQGVQKEFHCCVQRAVRPNAVGLYRSCKGTSVHMAKRRNNSTVHMNLFEGKSVYISYYFDT